MTTTLIIPGLYSSGPGHWQTWFEEQIPGTVRVIQSDWTKPDLPDWSRRVRRDLLKESGSCIFSSATASAYSPPFMPPPILATESTPLCWLPLRTPTGSASPLCSRKSHCRFPPSSLPVRNDPWMNLWSAAGWADRWGADFVNLGEAGHINAEFGFRAVA